MTNTPQEVVLVAALTYRRPEMLSILLEKLSGLQHPVGWKVRFLIVDNDDRASAQALVAGCASRFEPGALDYVVEPEPGIPFGRNRALDEATARGAKLLAFIDDDEYPERNWLRELVAHYEQTGAVLIGGPVRQLPPEYPTTAWLAFLSRSLVAQSRLMEAYCARRARRGKIDLIATNNWIGELAWIGSQRLRFDHNLRSSAADDAALFFEVRARGGKIEWCEHAVVYEHFASNRLSLRYHLTRAFAQGVELTSIRSDPIFRLCIHQSIRMLIGIGLVVFPAFGFASFAQGARMLANGAGRFAGLVGARSRLYARPGNDFAVGERDSPQDG